MTYIERKIVSLQSDASGDGIGYTPVVNGKIANVIYTKDGSNPYDDTVDITVTLESTGQTIWSESNVTASKTVAPRQPIHDTAGAASLYAGAGEPVEDSIVAAEDRVKIVIAQAGNAKDGQFTIITE